MSSASRDHERARRTGIVLTGGTVGSTYLDSGGHRLVSLGRDGPTMPQPELELLSGSDPFTGREIAVSQPVELLSENFLPEDWVKIADAVEELVTEEGAEEILIFHGTDTMTYTSAALAFLLPEIPVPVVLTGANKPVTQRGSDAPINVRAAFHALAALPDGVYIVFAGAPNRPGLVYSPTRSRKQHASGRAFASVNRRPPGRVDGGVLEFRGPPRPRHPMPKLREPDPAVVRFQIYPGLDLDRFGAMLDEHAIRGVVIELYPSFTASERAPRYSLRRFVERCGEVGCLVFAAVDKHPAGRPSVYETTSALGWKEVHVVNMIPETATVKLMLALGATSDPERVVEIMDTEIAGEFA